MADSNKQSKPKAKDPLKRFTDCAYFLRGTCNKPQCGWRHSEAAKVNANKTPPHNCRNWIATPSNCKDLDCKYAHPGANQASKPQTRPNKDGKKDKSRDDSSHNSSPQKHQQKTDGQQQKKQAGQQQHHQLSNSGGNHQQKTPVALPVPVAAALPIAIAGPRLKSAVFWDIENCAIPRGQGAFSVANRIMEALTARLPAEIVSFMAFANAAVMSHEQRLGLHRANVKLLDVPDRKPGAADRVLTEEVDNWCHLVSPPGCVVLVSGDIDYVRKLATLKARGYTIMVLHNAQAREELISVAHVAMKWSDVADSAVAGKKQKSDEKKQKAQQDKPAGAEKAKQPGQHKPAAEKSDRKPQQHSESSSTAKPRGNAPSKPESSPKPSNAKQGAAAKPVKPQNAQEKQKKPKKAPAYKCGSCPSSFRAELSLEQHQEAKRHWSCPVCSKAFQSGTALDSHQTDSDHLQLFCQVCSSGPFLSSKSRDHHRSSLGHWSCPQCDKLFQAEENLMQHQVSMGHFESDSDSDTDSDESSSEESFW